MTAPFLTALWVDFHLEREEPPGDPATGKQPLVLGVHTRGACDRRSAAVAAPCVPPPLAAGHACVCSPGTRALFSFPGMSLSGLRITEGVQGTASHPALGRARVSGGA